MIEQINEEFLRGAEDYRYSVMVRGTERWLNDLPKYSTPHNTSYYRTIKYKGDNTYMGVLDVDGLEFNRTSLSAAAKLYRSAKKLFGVEALLKASGMKGAQVIMDVDFPDNWAEKTCLHGLARIAFTLWKNSCVKRLFKVDFGLKLKGTYVDACMYKKGRVVRSFCKHLGSGLYSVPYKWTDTVNQVKDRMTLEMEPIWPEIPELWYPDIEKLLEDYEDSYYYETTGPSGAVLSELDSIIVKRGRVGKPDHIYTLLPGRLKKIADMSADVHHDFKHPLVAYMYYELKMEPTEIINWLWKNVQWSDLNSLPTTAYHVNWTCRWAQKIIDKGDNPVKRWVYEDVGVHNAGSS